MLAFYVVLGGFEPPQTEPKPVVLPLHHRTILNDNFQNCGAKVQISYEKCKKINKKMIATL